MASQQSALTYLSKADAVYAELRRRILEGELEPGAALNQEQLAGGLGVSTTPVREALRRLESEGFVRTVAHREVYVAPLEIDELVALYEVRENLDALAAALAAERHTPEDRDRIVQASNSFHEAAGGDALSRNRSFHAAIYRSCHNLVLIELLDALWDRADRYRRLVRSVADDEQVLLEHEKLVAAVLGRQADEAAQLMRDHLRSARRLIEESIRTGTGAVKVRA